MLDPRTHAVRADLADVRLAEFVFAPHYTACVPRRLHTAATLRQDRATDAEVMATLAPGDAFEMLDLVGDDAWGIAAAAGLVGYVDAAALEDPAA